MSIYYAVKTPRHFLFFYHAGNHLVCRTQEQNRLTTETILLKNACPYFTVTPHQHGLYVFCQDDGGLCLLTERDGRWHHRKLKQPIENDEASDKINDEIKSVGSTSTGISTKAHANTSIDVMVTPLLSEQGLCIVYNAVTEDTNGQSILMRRLNDSEWAQATCIDRFHPMGYAPYETQFTSKEHLLLFYQIRTSEHQLGYREVTPGRFGPYQKFYSASGPVSDASFLTTNEAVHMLYIVKSLFSCQLLYRRKTDALFETPVLLWESPRIDQCLLSFVYGRLYATCMSGGQLYAATSDDNGLSFSRMAIYKSKFCYDPVKAFFLSVSPLDTEELFVRQVYVDRNAPWDIQMIPDLYGDFFVFPEPEPEPEPAPKVHKDVLRDMQERLDAAEQSLKERDLRIMELMLQMKS